MIKSIRLIFCFTIMILNTGMIFAQPFFQRYDSIQVKINGSFVAYPWAGGLNFIQASNIDLDLDGKKDLFLFDRTGNKIRTFINKGIANTVDFRYDPKYESKFPKISDWALLADYNCDGLEDIFCYSSMGGGFDVYRNISTIVTGLKFQKVVTQQKSNFWPGYPPNVGCGQNLPCNLYISSVDIPAVSDIDNDGDLDIVTFGNSSTSIEYHKNLSKELYGTCDSLKFECKNHCWGYAAEDALSNDYTLNISCSNVPNPEIVTPDKDQDGIIDNTNTRSPDRHSGGCELCLDLDADEDKEFIVGDISYNNLTMLTNGGSPTSGIFTAKDVAFPANTTSTTAVDFSIFPCAFYADVNNDGVKDLIVSSNAPNVSENFNSVVYYKNNGANNAPIFQFQQSNLLQDNMIELGEGAYPVFFDYDNDGLKDLFIGNYGYYDKSTSNNETKIAQFRNIGTPLNPKFDLITRDYNNYSSLGIYNMVITFGDMDADGDADMFMGGEDGRIHYFENTGGAGAAVFPSSPTQAYYKNSNNRQIDVGDAAAPQIVDVDGDGKKDLVIGRRNGKIAYLHNKGTSAVPSMDSISYSWGNINVKGIYDIAGYSHPFVFKQGNITKLVTGAENGYIRLYDNIDGNLNGTFTLVDSTFMNVWEGERTAPSLADINSDGYLDMIIGNYQGGVIFLKGTFSLSVSNPDHSVHWDFELFPNPANHNVTIRINNEQNSNYEIELYNMLGQLITSQKTTNASLSFNTESFTQGVYVCKVSEINTTGEIKTGSLIKRIIIQH